MVMTRQLNRRELDCRRRLQGFTLIEVMIVVVIIGILSAIGYPAYTQQLMRGRRSDAQTMLMESAQYLQRYYATRNTFQGASLPSAYLYAPKGASSTTANYQISLAIGSDFRSYTLTATPNTSIFTDSTCGALTLKDTGVKGSTYGTTAVCWR